MARLVLHDAALADGRSSTLRVGVSLAISDGKIEWIRPADDADLTGAEVIDAGGATIVPALVDGHSHLVMQGGSHWIERLEDPPEVLRQVGRDNARRLVQAGVLWAIDVGAPSVDGRALSLDIREELRGKAGQPSIRAAGTWVAKTGYLPACIDADDGEALRRAALDQLDRGSDFVKIMLDAPPRGSAAAVSPFSAEEVRRTAEAVHARGARITAHSTTFAGARVAAEAGIDSIQHGTSIDDETARIMAKNNVALVATLSVGASWDTFAHTTRIERFASDAGKARMGERHEREKASVVAAQRAGVTIACGSDFGGGSVRAGHLAWEVELLVDAGLEPHDALAAATWRGGEVAGLPTAGKLEPGMPADFVLVHGDPLSDPRALWRVWAVYQRGTRVA
ncbi:MAG TPA: amidohydrolase family protein [Candidatus Limnocylindria bacterium]|nr:amidohydrolase family protein [Candidatus Limnocylindria bacterium]